MGMVLDNFEVDKNGVCFRLCSSRSAIDDDFGPGRTAPPDLWCNTEDSLFSCSKTTFYVKKFADRDTLDNF
jgi:hypothetical protein